MRKLLMNHVRPGMMTAQGLYDIQGSCLLEKNTVLTPMYIDRLKFLQIPFVYVTTDDSRLNIPAPPDIIGEQTRITAIRNVFNVFKSCHLTHEIDHKLLRSTISNIIRDLMNNENILFQISDIRTHDNYTFSHCVNVAALSVMVGIMLKYRERDLQDLAMGALLHDIGKILVQHDILVKPARLTDEEMEAIRHHPENGFRILLRTNQFSSAALRVVFEHHERMDGSGYPRKMRGGEIHEMAKIVAISDVYDALTSMRPYKKAYTPAVAYNIMKNSVLKQYDLQIFNLFCDHIALFPLGAVLKLSCGYGIVYEIKTGQTHRPIVRWFADKLKKELLSPKLVDLYENENIEIEYEIDEYERIELIMRLKKTPESYLNVKKAQ